MRSAFLALAAVAVALPALAAPAKPPKAVRDSVAAELAKAAEDMTDPDNPPTRDFRTPPASMFSRVDVNGDGVPDWKVDYAEAPNPSMWCGSGGCQVELWASQPGGGYAKVMDELVRSLRFVRQDGAPAMALFFHGSTCGGAGVDPCERRYAWNEDIGWVAIPNGSNGWLHGGPVELNPYLLNERPPEVEQAIDRIVQTCPTDGSGERPTWIATRLPDINGDGRTDWAVGNFYSGCGGAEEAPAPMIILASTPDGGLATAWEGGNVDYGVDISQTPAAFYVIPGGEECRDGDGRLCERPWGKRLRWDGASGKLVE